jgi:hypothetical protein
MLTLAYSITKRSLRIHVIALCGVQMIAVRAISTCDVLGNRRFKSQSLQPHEYECLRSHLKTH